MARFFCCFFVVYEYCYLVLCNIYCEMAYQWMQAFKAENQRKTVLLLILFPAVIFVIFLVVFTLFFSDTKSWDDGLRMTLEIFPLVLIGIGIWWIVSFVLQKDIMFWLSGAKPITRKDNPEVYNIVENLCISKWIQMPKIAIMDEPWMNAFATWWKKEDSWVAFTSGLLKNLDKKEIEAVAWHELTHLINRDSLLMYVAYVFVGAVTLAGEYILKFSSYGTSSSSDDSGRSSWVSWWFIFWAVFLLLWYLFYPLVRLAISRKREYMADLGSVELTKDNQSMISALRKISTNSYVAKANNSISSFFIAEPKVSVSSMASAKYWMKNYASSDWKIKTSIWDSHPSIDDRIARLQGY